MTPSSTLLRQLFPSWEFFDVTGLPPILQIRLLPSRDPAAGWRNVVRPPRRRWWHVLFNPAGTQTLAAQTLVETWCRELMEQDDTSTDGGRSLPLVMALAESAMEESDAPALRDGDRWQLRLIVTDDDDHVTVLYESERVPWPVNRVAR
jgi:hypothetical protein